MVMLLPPLIPVTFIFILPPVITTDGEEICWGTFLALSAAEPENSDGETLIIAAIITEKAVTSAIVIAVDLLTVLLSCIA